MAFASSKSILNGGKDDYIVDITYVIAMELGFRVTYGTVYDSIIDHPDYPSLLCITDTLNELGIYSLAATFDNEALVSLPTPFITQLRDNASFSESFSIVREINSSNVIASDPANGDFRSYTTEEFIKSSTGLAIIPEIKENVTGEDDYAKKEKSERQNRNLRIAAVSIFPIIFLLYILPAMFNNGYDSIFPQTAYIILSFLGVIICCGLILYELNSQLPFIRQICTIGKQTNCGAILNSSGSRIFGVTWSTIGFTYFLGQLSVLIIRGIYDSIALGTMSAVGFMACIFIPYSIYYQWSVMKQWCTLCLLVQALIFVQSIIAFQSGWLNYSIFSSQNPELYAQILFIYPVILILVNLILSAYSHLQDYTFLRHEFQRLKHDPKVFDVKVSSSRTLDYPSENLGIRFGNPQAPLSKTIVKVCNPYCRPCSKSHKLMKDLVNDNKDLQIRIIFTASNEAEDHRADVARHICALAEVATENAFENALDSWYLAEKKDYISFAKRHPLPADILQKQHSKIDDMKLWCENNSIAATPTFLVPIVNDNNNEISFHELQTLYSISDVKYHFLES